MQSTNNLKQIGLGLQNYHEKARSFPPGATFDASGQPLHSWQSMLLPYVERQDLYDQVDFNCRWDGPSNLPVFRTRVPPYLNPGVSSEQDAAGYALSHYAGNAKVLGGNVPRTIADIKDGGSATILAGEIAAGFKPWGNPTNWRDPALGINRTPGGFGSPFKGGANFLFVDGTVRFLKDSIDPGVLKALGTPAGGESIHPDSY
jgi:prepilin-type processing-associated H-X9-DG protein